MAAGPRDHQSLLDALPDLVCAFSPDTTITYVNPACAEFFGAAPSALVGVNYAAQLAEAERVQTLAAIAGLRPTAPEFTQLCRVAGSPGEPRVVEWHNRGRFDAAGTLLEVIACGRDVTARRHADERVRALTEHAPACIVDLDLDYRIRWINRVPDDLAPIQVIGSDLLRWVQPAWRERTREVFDRAVATREPQRYEAPAFLTSPTDGWLTCYVATYEVEGRLAGIVQIAADSTERQNALARLSANEALLAAIYDTASSAICLLDADRRFLQVNRAYCELTGYRAADLLGRRDLDLVIPPADEAVSHGAYARLRERGQHSRMLHLRRRDGSLVPVIGTSRQVVTTDGHVLTVACAIDLTEQERLAGLLRDSEEGYRALFETMQDAFALHEVVLDDDGQPSDFRYLAVNPAFEQLTARPAAELLGRSVATLGADLGLAWGDLLGEVAQTGQTLRLEHHDPTADRHFEVVAYRPRPAQVAVSLHDKTSRHRLEEQLRQASKMEAVGQLAGGVAHDFNNLLTTITGYTDLVLSDLVGQPELADDVRQIQRAADRAASLTRQLLAFSRKQVIEPRVIDLDETVTDLSRMLRRLIGEPIRLCCETSGGHWVLADPAQLEQVILNLAVNARDAMPDGGQLTIGTGEVELDQRYADRYLEVRPGRYVSLVVEDTGHGMDDATVQRIFEPFFTTKEVGQGTGLGLATVYGVIKQSGGHVECCSAPGAGTRFTIYLPAAAAPAAAAAAHASSQPLSGSATVLVVEDDTAVRELIRRTLCHYGYQAVCPATAAAAIPLAADPAQRLDLLITDVIMPDLSGREVADRVVALRPGLPVLFISGYAEDAIARHGVIDAATEFLQKPFTPRELAERLRQVLGPAR